MTTISKKVCLLGDFAVGKTSLIRRFVYNRFDETYLTTIGVHVSRKALTVPRDERLIDLALMIWDLAGENGFERVRQSYLRGAAGAVLVCDLTRADTLAGVIRSAEQVLSASPAARLVVAANKHDLANEQQLAPAQIEAVAGQIDAPLYLTSARTGDEVEALFRHLGRQLVI
ncbi:MAG: GTP-binding protein [Kouleothrix sp.]|nr:GTP-binding protein [Kouleothrix sp.]